MSAVGGAVDDRRFRGREQQRVSVECVRCGTLGVMQRGSLRKRVRRGALEWLCQPCRKPGALDDIGFETEARIWARAVWDSWSPAERAEVAGALQAILGDVQGEGEGEAARHRRHGRG